MRVEPSPGVDAVLPTERVFHRQPSVVELQSRETAFVQADHVSMCQSVTVGVVTWTHIQRHCVTTGRANRQVSVWRVMWCLFISTVSEFIELGLRKKSQLEMWLKIKMVK